MPGAELAPALSRLAGDFGGQDLFFVQTIFSHCMCILLRSQASNMLEFATKIKLLLVAHISVLHYLALCVYISY